MGALFGLRRAWRCVLVYAMATYLIGDVHGCFETLSRLLGKFGYESGADRIFMTGDLVNGGPGSAEVVRWARENKAGVVLGNHDLHLLAVVAGARAPRKNDTFLDLLEADDRDELVDWLQKRPLMIREEQFLLVHAGLLPEWDAEMAVRLAREVESILRSDPGRDFFSEMYGDEPRRWSGNLQGMDRIRVVINAMTRLRMVTPENEIDMEFKGPPHRAGAELTAWFEVPGRATAGEQVFFGHWAALGFHKGEKAAGLDSGCAWAGQLTAWRLEDGAVFQVPSELTAEEVALTRR